MPALPQQHRTLATTSSISGNFSRSTTRGYHTPNDKQRARQCTVCRRATGYFSLGLAAAGSPYSGVPCVSQYPYAQHTKTTVTAGVVRAASYDDSNCWPRTLSTLRRHQLTAGEAAIYAYRAVFCFPRGSAARYDTRPNKTKPYRRMKAKPNKGTVAERV